MKKFLLLTFLLLFGFVANAQAIPTLPSGDIVFEFNSWEYLTNRDPTDPNGPGYLLGIGDVLAGAVKLDNITDGSNTLYNPDNEGTEITGIFGGYEVVGINISDFEPDGTPNIISYTFDMTNAYLEVYFDDTPDFDEFADQTTALANASNGLALIEFVPEILEANAFTGNTVPVSDDKTNVSAWLNLAAYNALDPFVWNETPPYMWSEEFEKPAGSNIFYAFFMTQEVYSPGHTIFNQNASTTDASGNRLWDYYDTDDLRGSVHVVPEPTTILLFGFGLLGMASISRRRKK